MTVESLEGYAVKCSSDPCSEDAQVKVIEVRNRAFAREEQVYCEVHGNLFWTSYLAQPRIGTGRHVKVDGAVCFEPELIFVDERKHTQLISLREVGNARGLSFPIDFLQACSIVYAIQSSPYKRLLLHVAVIKLINMFGGNLSYTIIDDFSEQDLFRAKALIEHNRDILQLPIRASDAIALAVIGDVPFLVAELVLEKLAKAAQPGIRAF